MKVQDLDFRENLKPLTMALVSPRVFWNLVKQVDADVDKALRILLPQADWSFLDVRIRQLSQKAMDYKHFQEMEKEEKEMRSRKRRKKNEDDDPEETVATAMDDTEATAEASGVQAGETHAGDDTAEGQTGVQAEVYAEVSVPES